jgi:hypothetical protein
LEHDHDGDGEKSFKVFVSGQWTKRKKKKKEGL